MKLFARVENDVLVEFINEFVDIEGQQIPVALRYTEEFISDLVDVSNSTPLPEVGFVYKGGVFTAPVVVEPSFTNDEVEIFRLTAYANPVTGSDRYFSESLALQAEGFAATSTEVKEAKAKGLARKLEIQTLYPYPAE